ncbi:glycoside hydrolase family 19 protein [Variovorax sp. J22G21]|uniref:XVIPCD domain-containing protein n=1 Tax=Variovorax fucosicus TaxID=3053517 RepID=UPI002577FA85|nr:MULTISPECIES: XVIPCD domain-containing protein [unclassified Variovorax]MDM0040273.1 glycoside hydrolase family 19 protein [Variovorax sp. J22R193]MDM0058391.1 glycoside hydrolase family 19 protein [Variovorax sp. J22G47]MDM0061646.1 glycoside hydrolase family 19 protein [Variovorax sp. J22G21]
MPHPPRPASHSHHAHHATPYSKENSDLILQAAQSARITDAKELANFMGQMQVESRGFTKMHENLNYSGERLLKVFPGRNGMDTLEKANAIAAEGPEKVAEAIYGGEWGKRPGNLGNTEPGDGWKYHGRGFVQLTGRDNYAHYGKALGLDLVNHPDLAAEPANAAKIAVQYWKERVVALGHQHDIKHATKDVNGHYNALPERKTAAAEWETKLAHGYKPGDPEPGQTLQDKTHPGHALYEQALHKLEKWNHDHQIKVDSQSTKNSAAALAVEAHQHGLTRIDHVQPNDRGDKLIAAQGQLGTAQSKVIGVDTVVALTTPLAQSSQSFIGTQQLQQPANLPAQQAQQMAQPSPAQAQPALSR